MNEPGEGVPSGFRRVVAALSAARPRSEVQLTPMPPPKRLAPYAVALEASVVPVAGPGGGHEEDEEELADGRFVLLHDPDGQDGWFGTLRVVTLARASMDPELGADPLLPEVTWSWLTEALDGSRGPGWAEPSGTVTLAASQSFGALAERPPRTEVELRASWSPREEETVAGHLLGWCGLLAQCAGLPPEPASPGVAALPRRRTPRRGDPHLG
ncbi:MULTISPECIES: DUF3000 domain-containing protein [Streptomyces]|uniref:DUF3000 domain-containing protein n=1 Tax=Streptomyces TaxID=1883 RepID=UPI000CD4C3A4|nr:MULTISPECIES: DUF3000 domain-containing protein [Streptomyces]